MSIDYKLTDKVVEVKVYSIDDGGNELFMRLVLMHTKPQRQPYMQEYIQTAKPEEVHKTITEFFGRHQIDSALYEDFFRLFEDLKRGLFSSLFYYHFQPQHLNT